MISLLLAMAGVAQAPKPETAPAFVAVVMGCFLHSSGASPIVADRAAEITAAGMAFVPQPPAEIATRVKGGFPAQWGTPSFAQVSGNGENYWVVGFSSGNCLIDATGASSEKLKADILEQFTTPGVPWKRLPADRVPDRFGAEVSQKGEPTRTIIANIIGQSLPDGRGEEVVTFELAPANGTH